MFILVFSKTCSQNREQKNFKFAWDSICLNISCVRKESYSQIGFLCKVGRLSVYLLLANSCLHQLSERHRIDIHILSGDVILPCLPPNQALSFYKTCFGCLIYNAKRITFALIPQLVMRRPVIWQGVKNFERHFG